jgi:hypothetical protein
MATCSTRPGIARARPGARPRAHRAAPSQTRAPARARAYNANQGLDRTPPLTLNLAGALVHRWLLCARRASGHPRTDHFRPAILAIPCLVRPSREPLRVSVKLPEPGIELNVAGLHPTAGVRRPSSTVSLSSIPCTGRLLSTPWSSLCPRIEPYRREQAGAHAADEPDRLHAWTDRFRPSPSTSRTSKWPHGLLGANPTLHRTSLAASKPRCPVYFRGYCLKGGRDLGEEGKEVRGGFWMVRDLGE